MCQNQVRFFQFTTSAERPTMRTIASSNVRVWWMNTKRHCLERRACAQLQYAEKLQTIGDCAGHRSFGTLRPTVERDCTRFGRTNPINGDCQRWRTKHYRKVVIDRYEMPPVAKSNALGLQEVLDVFVEHVVEACLFRIN
jgi:hypothetical protein